MRQSVLSVVPPARHAGHDMHALAQQLWPLNRSLTGDGVRQTLAMLKSELPDGLAVHEIASGTKCFDWTVPDEWNLLSARLMGPGGAVIADTSETNLRVLGYSEPIDRRMPLEELQPHLYSMPAQPDWIPYATSYYKRAWGFCLRQRERDMLLPGIYHARIDATLAPGALTYADLVIPGDSADEILFSTYVCHPSVANNELSGPLVTTWLARHIAGLERRRFTYRFVFAPETIGAIVYLSRHLDHLRARLKAGYVVTCVGDERTYSFLPTPNEDSWADRVATHVLDHHAPSYKRYSFLDRGSDERQYCWPGVDLPVASVMRSKYGAYPEYHTSADDLTLVTPNGLNGALQAHIKIVEALESDRTYRATTLCEPQMGKRGLYSALGSKGFEDSIRTRMNVLAYCDGKRSLLDIAAILKRPIADLAPFAEELLAHDLIKEETRP
jgi:aminopeptidase-like protein